eukprot:g9671.t1
MRPILSGIVSNVNRYRLQNALKLYTESTEEKRKRMTGIETKKQNIYTGDNSDKKSSPVPQQRHQAFNRYNKHAKPEMNRNPMFNRSINNLNKVTPSPSKQAPQTRSQSLRKKIYGMDHKLHKHRDLVDMMIPSSRKQKQKNQPQTFIDVDSLELEKVGKKFYYFDFKKGMIYDMNYNLVGEIGIDGAIHIRVNKHY